MPKLSSKPLVNAVKLLREPARDSSEGDARPHANADAHADDQLLHIKARRLLAKLRISYSETRTTLHRASPVGQALKLGLTGTFNCPLHPLKHSPTISNVMSAEMEWSPSTARQVYFPAWRLEASTTTRVPFDDVTPSGRASLSFWKLIRVISQWINNLK